MEALEADMMPKMKGLAHKGLTQAILAIGIAKTPQASACSGFGNFHDLAFELGHSAVRGFLIGKLEGRFSDYSPESAGYSLELAGRELSSFCDWHGSSLSAFAMERAAARQ